MLNLPEFSIRIEAPDSDAVRHILAASVEADDSTDSGDLFAPNAEFIVARWNGRAVGCVALLDRIDHGEARRLYVIDEMRGKGIAAALVLALENAARDIGLRQVWLRPNSAHENQWVTFSRLGFEPATVDGGAWMAKSL